MPTLRAVLSQYPLAPWDSRAGRRGARDDERFGSIPRRAGGRDDGVRPRMAAGGHHPRVRGAHPRGVPDGGVRGRPRGAFERERRGGSGPRRVRRARASRATSGPSAGLPDPARRPRGSFVSAAASRDASSSADEPAADAHRLTPVWCRDADGRTVVVRARPARSATTRPRSSRSPTTGSSSACASRWTRRCARSSTTRDSTRSRKDTSDVSSCPPGTTTPRAYSSRRRPQASHPPSNEYPSSTPRNHPPLDLLRAHVEGPSRPPSRRLSRSAESGQAAESSAAPSGSSSSRARCASVSSRIRRERFVGCRRWSADRQMSTRTTTTCTTPPRIRSCSRGARCTTGLEHRLGEDPSKGDAAGGRRGGRHETARAIGAALAEAVGGGVGDAVAAATAAAGRTLARRFPGRITRAPSRHGKTVIVAAYLARDHAEREGEGEDDPMTMTMTR